MQFIGHTEPKMLIAEAGKKIRAKNDVYTPAHTDEEGTQIEEVNPTYSDFVFLAKGIDTQAEAEELYTEEEINDAT